MEILVAVPTHSGAIDAITAETLLATQKALLERGDQCRTIFPSAAMIPMLRNLIVADFLGGQADMLLALDADQGLPVETVLRMIDLGEPFVGCLYPRRRYDWGRVAEAQGSLPDLLLRAMDFVGAPMPPEPGTTAVVLRDGFLKASHVGGGAMLLRRTVFDRLKTAHPELKGRGFDAAEFTGPRFAENWGFFNPMEIDGLPVAEDFSFCERWRAAGGVIWADATAQAAHVGRQVFAGRYVDHVAALSRAQGD